MKKIVEYRQLGDNETIHAGDLWTEDGGETYYPACGTTREYNPTFYPNRVFWRMTSIGDCPSFYPVSDMSQGIYGFADAIHTDENGVDSLM